MRTYWKANVALAAALVFLMLSGCAGYMAFSRLTTSEEWVHHTREVQNTLAQFSMASSRAGRLRAEFAESGDLSLLPKFAEQVGKVRNAIASATNLTADNPAQQQNCEHLRQFSEKRIAVMESSINLKRGGNSTLQAQDQITREIMAAAEDGDALLQQMDDTEDQLLTERELRVKSSSVMTSAILITSMFLTLVLFLIHNQLLTEQVRARTRAEEGQRALSARLLNMQDQERRKFARELHDSVGQHLAAAKMALSMLQKKLPDDTTMRECLKLLDDSIAETRTISHLLHPPLLDEAGLISAVRWFVEGFAKRSGIETNLDIEQSSARFPEAVELALFRVLQESLTNVHRHSGATRADVSLRSTPNSAVLQIKDYGRGIPAQLLDGLGSDSNAGGVGLAGMRERVREIGGQIDISSNASGTTITVRVPIIRPAQQFGVAEPGVQEVRG